MRRGKDDVCLEVVRGPYKMLCRALLRQEASSDQMVKLLPEWMAFCASLRPSTTGPKSVVILPEWMSIFAFLRPSSCLMT